MTKAKPNVTLTTTCCIVGGGPAGMMLALLLARKGIEVVILEKHAEFFRDFRGDTIHPSTLEVISELGFLDEFLDLPHNKVFELKTNLEGRNVTLADFSELDTIAPYIAMIPQWDFLNFLKKKAAAYPNFTCLMETSFMDFIYDSNERITGIIAETPKGTLSIHADLVIGADGRHSATRDKAQLEVQDFGVPIDVLWFQIARKESDRTDSMGRFLPGTILVTINRGDYWQCGYVIPKGEIDRIKAEGLKAVLEKIAKVEPLFENRTKELKSWDQIRLLTVKVDFLKKWYRPGLLCIGDAAHAMSPVGGVGINLAIQDAIATANRLAEPLNQQNVTESDLEAIQRRRTFPVKMTQAMQLMMHKRILFSALKKDQPFQPPFILKVIFRSPLLQKLIGYIIGIGFRAEHVRL